MTGTRKPYESALAAADNQGELHTLWTKFTSAGEVHEALGQLRAQGVELTEEEYKARMAAEWEARSAELRAHRDAPPTDRQVTTARKRLAEIDDESMQATLDYGDAVQEWATTHADYKKMRARKYTELKAEWAGRNEKLTDGMAEMLSDADEAIADLYFKSELAEAKTRAAQKRLDHLDRSFNYHRSLMVREDRNDNRPGV